MDTISTQVADVLLAMTIICTQKGVLTLLLIKIVVQAAISVLHSTALPATLYKITG